MSNKERIKVKVSNDNKNWKELYFVEKKKDFVIVVSPCSEEKFLKNKPYYVVRYRFWKA